MNQSKGTSPLNTFNHSKDNLISPEHKDQIIKRARKLSGIIKPLVEEDKSTTYNFRQRSVNKQADKTADNSVKAKPVTPRKIWQEEN